MYMTSGLENFAKRLPVVARLHSRGSVKRLWVLLSVSCSLEIRRTEHDLLGHG